MIFLFLLACTGGTPKDSTIVGNDDSTTDSPVDTGAGKTCNTDNESCAPGGSCRGEGINMLPGADCISCHTRGGEREAPPFQAAGTVFNNRWGDQGQGGVTVRITDADGTVFEERTSNVGNFEISQTMSFPIRAEVESSAGIKQMADEISTGACNSCHSCEGEAGGKLYAQQ
jgi:hypothetical protein